MPFESVTGKALAALVLLIAAALGGFFYGSHVRGLHDGKAYAALQASQFKAVLDATQAARDAQAQADAAQLAQQQAATAEANAAANRHAADLNAANASIASLRVKLNATAAKQPTVKDWLATPVPYGVFQNACKPHSSSNAGC